MEKVTDFYRLICERGITKVIQNEYRNRTESSPKVYRKNDTKIGLFSRYYDTNRLKKIAYKSNKRLEFSTILAIQL